MNTTQLQTKRCYKCKQTEDDADLYDMSCQELVCEDCYRDDDQLVGCEDCYNIVDTNEEGLYDGLCESCYDVLHTACRNEDCPAELEGPLRVDDTIDGFCEYCYYQIHKQCEKCGEYTKKEDMLPGNMPYSSDLYCLDCWSIAYHDCDVCDEIHAIGYTCPEEA